MADERATPARVHVGIDNPSFNRALGVVVAVALVANCVTLFMAAGNFAPPWLLIPGMFAIAAMLVMHIVRHLGVKAAAIYLVAMMAWEFLSEQIDIHTHGGWYGAHFAYTDLWGPRFLGVPLVPPVSIAMLVWPVFCCVSVLFYRNYAPDHRGRSWLETCVVAIFCGVLVSWMPVVYEAVCINIGAYTYPQIEHGQVTGFWGAPIGTGRFAMPAGVFPGFTILVILQVITLVRCIAPTFAPSSTNPPRSLHRWLDAVPVAFFFTMAVGLAKVAMTVEARIFAIYTGVFYAALALFGFYQAVRRARTGQ